MCNYIENNNQRDLFRDTIQEKLIGPGADIFGFDKEEELISKNPTKLYYSGILFSRVYSDSAIAENNTEEAEELMGEGEAEEVEHNPDQEEVRKDFSKEDVESSRQMLQTFFTSKIGLIFAVNNDTENLNVSFSYAQYKPATSRQIKITLEEYNKLIEILHLLEEDNNLCCSYGDNFFTRNDNLEYDINEQTLTINNVPSLNHAGEIKSIFWDADFKTPFYNAFRGHSFLQNKFYKLCSVIYKRNPTEANVEIDLDNLPDPGEGVAIENTSLQYFIKVMPRNGNKIVKVLLQNNSDAAEKSYADCYFQIKIKVDTTDLTNYHEPIHSVIDEDYSTVEYQYKDVHSYGKGINCAATWVVGQSIETSFLPEKEINSFSNDENEEIINAGISHIFELKNLSIWTALSDEEIINNLTTFVNTYNEWINVQQETANQDGNPNAHSLVALQRTAHERLITNINYLQENPEAFKCFKLANTAMLIQMIVAKDKRFKKGREFDQFNVADNMFNDINFFKNYVNLFEKPFPKYRPFQLAFLLMNVESTFNNASADRNDLVDLIWFPTGGGKTEAYLALTALTIIERRRNNPDVNTDGVSVMMRYTLRLLTAQQFERATWLICALEFLRNKLNDGNGLHIGTSKITIGMWVGGTTTPNELANLNNVPYNTVFNILRPENVNARFTIQTQLESAQNANKFPISYCPWCGCNQITIKGQQVGSGYMKEEDNFYMRCLYDACFYNGEAENTLPIQFIDELIYRNPPTLLFATVDKMVRLSHKQGAGNLFRNKLPPDLIIQDELHLLTGPLGTLCGLYEVLIDQLCSTDDRKPKIVASTATTRNTKSVVKAMYNRELNIFPAQGVRFRDNFFSFVNEESKRKHLGVMPTGRTAGLTEIKLVECIYEAKVKLLTCFLQQHNIDISNKPSFYEKLNSESFRKDIDPYWTLVMYYNNLRDLGRSKSKVLTDFEPQIKGMFKNLGVEGTFDFILHGIFQRTVEFTSRQESGKIKALLTRTESPVSFVQSGEEPNTLIFEDNQNSIDIALASNMFSVGIDVERLNMMLMMGQPGSVSEYIQSSSRVARKDKGLVINLLNPMRPRELSVFEDYTAFHEAYYKNVEPLSITPFTEMAIDKLLDAVLVGFVRQLQNQTPNQFTVAMADELKTILQQRITSDEQRTYAMQKIDQLKEEWAREILNNSNIHFIKSQYHPGLVDDLMNSLRDIESDVFIENVSLR